MPIPISKSLCTFINADISGVICICGHAMIFDDPHGRNGTISLSCGGQKSD